MSYKVDLYINAKDELQNAYEWYKKVLKKLAERFISAVNKRLYEIAAHPERYPKKKKNYRETRVNTFPYLIIDEVLKKEQTILVLHVFHAKCNPRKKYLKN